MLPLFFFQSLNFAISFANMHPFNLPIHITMRGIEKKEAEKQLDHINQNFFHILLENENGRAKMEKQLDKTIFFEVLQDPDGHFRI